jgi:hypothetical protein
VRLDAVERSAAKIAETIVTVCTACVREIGACTESFGPAAGEHDAPRFRTRFEHIHGVKQFFEELHGDRIDRRAVQSDARSAADVLDFQSFVFHALSRGAGLRPHSSWRRG